MTSSDVERGGRLRGIGRRRFLTGLGVGAAGALTLSNVEALAEQVEGLVPNSAPDRRFSRLFELPAFADPQYAPTRQVLLPQHRLPAIPAEPGRRHVHDDRPTPVGKGGSRQPRPVNRLVRA
ncbi:MAG: twin-arginine translocation signal domain-containing protein [Pseudonocardiaceae bacterium]